MLEKNNAPIITIGIPVYNGGEHIQSRLENILSQTFQNFEIIISNNKSTDLTHKICQEYVAKDNRIKYFQQDVNIGGSRNYQFVLNKAKTKYFVFATDDDKWDKTFLEKNISILENNSLMIGSIGKIGWTGENLFNEFNQNEQDNLFQKYYKKVRKIFRHHGPDSIIEKTFEKRAAVYLRLLLLQNPSFDMYAVFRTIPLQKSMIPKITDKEFYQTFWNSCCINVLEYGSIYLIDEILIYYNQDGGSKGTNVITEVKKNNAPKSDIIFPWYTTISWYIHKFGLKFFLRYSVEFLGLFLMGEIILLQSIYKEFKNKSI